MGKPGMSMSKQNLESCFMTDSKAHASNTNKSRKWSPKLRSVKFGDRRTKRNKTRERQLREAFKREILN